MLGSGLWTPAGSDDDQGQNGEQGEQGQVCPAPDPIPQVTIPPIPLPVIATCVRGHFFFPGNVDGTMAGTDPTGTHAGGRDPSTIFNFDGVIGQADLNMTGTGTDTTTGQSAPHDFHADMRFMAGKFVGSDGRVHKGAFVFI